MELGASVGLQLFGGRDRRELGVGGWGGGEVRGLHTRPLVGYVDVLASSDCLEITMKTSASVGTVL